MSEQFDNYRINVYRNFFLGPVKGWSSPTLTHGMTCEQTRDIMIKKLVLVELSFRKERFNDKLNIK